MKSNSGEKTGGDLLAYAHAIFDTMREVLVVLDGQLRVKAANSTFYKTFQLHDSEIVNTSLYDLNAGQWKVPALENRLEGLLSVEDDFKDIEVNIEMPGRDLRTFLVTARRLIQVDEAELSILLVAQDITDLQQTKRAFSELQKELEERVRRRTSELASANAELDAFAYSVSHDLRAPLRAVAGFGRALEEDYGDKLDAEGTRYLQHVQEGAQRMSNLIDDLLQLSRVTRCDIEYRPVDLSAIAGVIVEELRAAYPDRNAAVEIEGGVVAEGDETLLTVVLRNLLENAWKYTIHESNAQIAFHAEQRGSEVVYCVSDSGVGFDMSFVDKLFQPFQRLHTSYEFEGNGIGLATAHRVLTRHGGRIWCDAEIGRGATFFFTLN